MASSGYTAWSVTAGEQPTTAYWNILGTNDESFNTGTGFNDGIIVSRHIAAQQAWQTPTLATGWGNFDSSGPGHWGFPQYMKDTLGFVHLRGLAMNTSGVTNSNSTNPTIFTLPAGYQPYQRVINVTNGYDQFIRLDVWDNGNVFLSGTAGETSIPNGGWLSLNNIIFLAGV